MNTTEKDKLKRVNAELLSESKREQIKKQFGVIALNEKMETVHHFPNRMIAAKFIAEQKGESPKNKKKVMQIYGNLYSGLKNAWKVYGYYWVLTRQGGTVRMTPYYVINESTCTYFVHYGEAADIENIDSPDVVVLTDYDTFLAKNDLLGLTVADSISDVVS